MTPEAAIAALDRALEQTGEWATIRRRSQHQGVTQAYFDCRVKLLQKVTGGYDFAGGVQMEDGDYWLSPTQMVNAQFPWPLQERDIVILDSDGKKRHIGEEPRPRKLGGTIVRYEFVAREVGNATV